MNIGVVEDAHPGHGPTLEADSQMNSHRRGKAEVACDDQAGGEKELPSLKRGVSVAAGDEEHRADKVEDLDPNQRQSQIAPKPSPAPIHPYPPKGLQDHLHDRDGHLEA